MKLILVDPNPSLCREWRTEFRDCPEVRVHEGYFQDLQKDGWDCLVSAANSFGLMDGGVDGAITAFFGNDLQKRVQRTIAKRWRGEQPIGTSFIARTHHQEFPYLAHTPTMRVPEDISQTDNVYYAMRAMLLTVEQFNENVVTNARGTLRVLPRGYGHPDVIHTIVCPGLGTGTGKVSPYKAARQMWAAYYSVYKDDPMPTDQEDLWDRAKGRHDLVRGKMDLSQLMINERRKVAA